MNPRPTAPSTGGRASLRRPVLVLLVLFGIPLALAAAAVAVVLAWAPELPDPLAIHWGADGADGYSSLGGFIALIAATLVGIALLLGLIGVAAIRAGQPMRALRILAALQLATAGLLAVGMTASAAIQRGLSDAADADGAGLGRGMLVAAACAIALGAVGALALPRQHRTTPAGVSAEPAPALHLGAEERAVWTGRAAMETGVLAAILLTLGAVALLPVLVGVEGWASLGGVGVALLILPFLFWRVRVDRRGLTTRSALGWPRWSMAAGDIVEARAVAVNPLAEFGGWGIRFGGGGRWGLVLRRGSAVEIHRAGRAPFVVTVDGAEEAAALLNGYRHRDA
jgi:hypothetical protein